MVGSIPLVNAVFVMINRSMSGTSLMEAKSDHVHDILLKENFLLNPFMPF